MSDILMILKKIVAFPFFFLGMVAVIIALGFMSAAMFITGEEV